MNANELADKLEYLYQQDDADGIQMPVFLHSATMLRQQQAEIEELRNQLWELKSEPWGFDTHPIKELTDEKITACMRFLPKYNSEITDEDLVKFARAILKMASEK